MNYILILALSLYSIAQVIGIYILLAPVSKADLEMDEKELVRRWRSLKLKQQGQTNGKA